MNETIKDLWYKIDTDMLKYSNFGVYDDRNLITECNIYVFECFNEYSGRVHVNTLEDIVYNQSVIRINIGMSNLLKVRKRKIKGYTHTILSYYELLDSVCLILDKAKKGDTLDDIQQRCKRYIRQLGMEKKAVLKPKTLDILNDMDRFVIKVHTPTYERVPENINKNTFDFVRVFIDIPSNKSCSIEDCKLVLKNYRVAICNKLLTKIAEHSKFQKFGVPVNILKLSKITLLENFRQVEFVFELKNMGCVN